MNETSKVTTEKPTAPPAKPLVTKFDIAVYITLLLLEAILAFAWFHSRISPIRKTWNDPSAGAGSRLISANGRLLWQRCVVSDLQLPPPEKRLPFNVVVGSNPDGERTPIQCGEVEVSFAYPAEDRWVGAQSAQSAFSNGSLKYRIEWSETTASYPAMMVAVVIVLILCAIDPLVRLLIRRLRRA
jgi:hypothetical protein